MHEYIAVFHV